MNARDEWSLNCVQVNCGLVILGWNHRSDGDELRLFIRSKSRGFELQRVVALRRVDIRRKRQACAQSLSYFFSKRNGVINVSSTYNYVLPPLIRSWRHFLCHASIISTNFNHLLGASTDLLSFKFPFITAWQHATYFLYMNYTCWNGHEAAF